jgi:HPt (histidine-containing phosphotransfer) domain-containing protein
MAIVCHAATPIRFDVAHCPAIMRELERAIAEVISPRDSTKGPVPQSDQAEGKIDHVALLAGVDGNLRLLREMVRLFLADYPQHLAAIKKAVERRDALGLEKAAHTLKGSVGNFAARHAFAAAQQLETMARKGELDAARAISLTLESELAHLTEELRNFTTGSSIPRRGRHGQV